MEHTNQDIFSVAPMELTDISDEDWQHFLNDWQMTDQEQNLDEAQNANQNLIFQEATDYGTHVEQMNIASISKDSYTSMLGGNPEHQHALGVQNNQYPQGTVNNFQTSTYPSYDYNNYESTNSQFSGTLSSNFVPAAVGNNESLSIESQRAYYNPGTSEISQHVDQFGFAVPYSPQMLQTVGTFQGQPVPNNNYYSPVNAVMQNQMGHSTIGPTHVPLSTVMQSQMESQTLGTTLAQLITTLQNQMVDSNLVPALAQLITALQNQIKHQTLGSTQAPLSSGLESTVGNNSMSYSSAVDMPPNSSGASFSSYGTDNYEEDDLSSLEISSFNGHSNGKPPLAQMFGYNRNISHSGGPLKAPNQSASIGQTAGNNPHTPLSEGNFSSSSSNHSGMSTPKSAFSDMSSYQQQFSHYGNQHDFVSGKLVSFVRSNHAPTATAQYSSGTLPESNQSTQICLSGNANCPPASESHAYNPNVSNFSQIESPIPNADFEVTSHQPYSEIDGQNQLSGPTTQQINVAPFWDDINPNHYHEYDYEESEDEASEDDEDESSEGMQVVPPSSTQRGALETANVSTDTEASVQNQNDNKENEEAFQNVQQNTNKELQQQQPQSQPVVVNRRRGRPRKVPGPAQPQQQPEPINVQLNQPESPKIARKSAITASLLTTKQIFQTEHKKRKRVKPNKVSSSGILDPQEQGGAVKPLQPAARLESGTPNCPEKPTFSACAPVPALNPDACPISDSLLHASVEEWQESIRHLNLRHGPKKEHVSMAQRRQQQLQQQQEQQLLQQIQQLQQQLQQLQQQQPGSSKLPPGRPTNAALLAPNLAQQPQPVVKRGRGRPRKGTSTNPIQPPASANAENGVDLKDVGKMNNT